MQFQAGIHSIEDPSLPPPSPVKDFTVKADEKNNRLLLSWRYHNGKVYGLKCITISCENNTIL